MAKTKMVTAVFEDRLASESALDYLAVKGYDRNEINILLSDKTPLNLSRGDHKAHPADSKATEGMGVGGAIGTAVGATAAAVAAIGTSLAIPGLGLIVAGPIAAALAGGGVGAVTGGAIGALVGAGIPEGNAEAYQAALANGGVVVGVTPHDNDDASDIQEKFKELGGDSVCYC